MTTGDIPTTRGLKRRTFLALSAAGTASAALGACGGTTPAPTNTAAPAAPTTAGPAPTTTPVPQTLGSAATSAPAAASAPATTGTTASSTVAATVSAAPANLADKQTFRFAAPEPINFDPANCQNPVNEPQVFEGLVTVSWKDGTLSPALAQSYEANSDATVWTFKMRPGTKWSDGTPLTAKDFEYAWRRVVDPKTASIYTASLTTPKVKNALDIVNGKVPPDQLGAKALDDATFQVTLDTPAPYFPLLAATWTCYPTPRHVIEKFGPKWLEAANIVGNGPYVLKDWKHDQIQVFEPNPNYWGPKPTITHAECIIYDDVLTKGLPAYENNELDSAQISAGDYDRVRNDPKLSKELKGYQLSQTNMLHSDTTNKPMSDVRVRNALSLGFDRDVLINNVLKNYYLKADTILPPDIAGHNPAAALTGGVAKAKQLMADAGFPNGQGWPSDFSIVYATDSIAKTILEYIQQEWKKNLGIDVQLQALDSKAYVAWRTARATQQYYMHYGAWGSDYGDPSNWHNFLFSSQTDFYHTHWKNDQFEGIIAQAKGATDVAARTKMYQDAEVILVQQGASIPINYNQAFFVTKPNVQGVYHPAVLGTYPRLNFISITK